MGNKEKLYRSLLFIVLSLSGLFLVNAISVNIDAETLTSDPRSGWVEYIFNDFNTSNRLTVTAGQTVWFNSTDYSVRDKELPLGITSDDVFNGSHVLLRSAGSSFIERWRFNFNEVSGSNGYCQVFYHIGGDVPPLIIRQIRSTKGQNVDDIDTFTNLQYGLDTWFQNGANISVTCYNQDFEFWDIEATFQQIHLGRGDY